MDSAEKREEVVLTHTEEIDVFDDDHLVVFDRKERAVQQMVDITLIALRHKRQGFGHALGRFEQAVATRSFPQGDQHFGNQRLEHR
jgi:hypothetical protein